MKAVSKFHLAIDFTPRSRRAKTILLRQPAAPVELCCMARLRAQPAGTCNRGGALSPAGERGRKMALEEETAKKLPKIVRPLLSGSQFAKLPKQAIAIDDMQ
jgi:hypothetical protein